MRNKISFYGNDLLFYDFNDLQNNYTDSRFMVKLNYSYKDFSIGQKDFNSKELYTNNYPGTFPTLPGRGYFRRGDKGLQVILVQKYLNWFGNYKLTETNKNYFDKTVSAVKDFQKKNGLTVDGEFGSKSLAKAKTPGSGKKLLNMLKKQLLH